MVDLEPSCQTIAFILLITLIWHYAYQKAISELSDRAVGDIKEQEQISKPVPEFQTAFVSSVQATQPTAEVLPEDTLKEITLHRDIILRTKNPYTGTSCSPQAQLEARTLPNARLRTTFGVNNAFTTQNMKTASAFKQVARSLLRKTVGIKKVAKVDGSPSKDDTEAQWTDIVSKTQRVVHEKIDGNNEIINVAEVVQYITLNVSLHCLFDVTAETLETRDAIRYVAKTINILWIQSKDKIEPGDNAWMDEQRLHHHLYTLTGLDPKDDLINPMNLILPAYETMWRAVFRGIVEVYFRNDPESSKWQSTLRQFMSSPEKEIFRGGDSTDMIYALDIVKEILRMYPPTRRVNRRFPDDPEGVTRSADIEKCHRNPLLVPTGDAEVFRPERWLQIKKDFAEVQAEREEEMKVKRPNATYTLSDYEGELGYMPFALSCPAGAKVTQGFGFKMIGLLVIALCDGFESLNRRGVHANDDDDLEDDVCGNPNVTVNRTNHHDTADANKPLGDDNTDIHLTFASDSQIADRDIIQDPTQPDDIQHSNTTHNISRPDSSKDTTRPDHEPQLQKWKLQAESPRDELPPLGTALKSGRSDYLSLVYRRIV